MQYEIYKKNDLETQSNPKWYWRLVKVVNGYVISVSPIGYDSKEECENYIHLNTLADYLTPIRVIDDQIKRNFLSGFTRKSKTERKPTT